MWHFFHQLPQAWTISNNCGLCPHPEISVFFLKRLRFQLSHWQLQSCSANQMSKPLLNWVVENDQEHRTISKFAKKDFYQFRSNFVLVRIAFMLGFKAKNKGIWRDLTLKRCRFTFPPTKSNELNILNLKCEPVLPTYYRFLLLSKHSNIKV